jgi:phosphoglycolate phosphatase-like HAD superfamily hydrolase
MLWKWVNSGRQAFILDLDGTLMPSAEIDNECFWRAVFSCLGKRQTLPELQDFSHVTDTGILHEWCERELGRKPVAEETARIKQHFLSELEAAADHQPAHFDPLPGVVEWLEAVAGQPDVYAGIATGGWELSARLKLQLSGLDRFGLPLASSDDAISRAQIMRIAAQRTCEEAAENPLDFTYVGDGVWDLQASRELGWSFIGIASGARAKQLKMAGARVINVNFCKT